MDSKSIFASKTFWANILGPLFLWLGTKYGVQLDAETQMAIIGGAMALANIALRLMTKQPVHVAAPASSDSAAKALLPLAFAAALGVGLSACASTSSTSSTSSPVDSAIASANAAVASQPVQSGIAVACNFAKAADISFQVIAATGKISAADIENEKTVMASVAAVCANPPQNAAQAVAELMAAASQITGFANDPYIQGLVSAAAGAPTQTSSASAPAK